MRAFAAIVITSCITCVFGSENVSHRPFAEWAELPEKGQFVAGLVYEESEAYNIWAGGVQHGVKWKSGGESYGIDVNQGYITLQYGITAKFAADFNFGGTTVGWRYFTQGSIQSTTGFSDSSFGLRYQVWNEAQASSPWIPTLTFRAGGVIPGSYNENFAFAPGLHSTALEPEVLVRKHFGWSGFGGYGDGIFRWNTTTDNGQYIIAVGFFQQINRWELDIGYRHLQTLSGSDIVWLPDQSIIYPRDPRENNDAIEAGFSYRTPKRHNRYGFHTRAVVDGNNSDDKFWVGGSIDFPFGGKPAEPKDTK